MNQPSVSRACTSMQAICRKWSCSRALTTVAFWPQQISKQIGEIQAQIKASFLATTTGPYSLRFPRRNDGTYFKGKTASKIAAIYSARKNACNGVLTSPILLSSQRLSKWPNLPTFCSPEAEGNWACPNQPFSQRKTARTTQGSAALFLSISRATPRRLTYTFEFSWIVCGLTIS